MWSNEIGKISKKRTDLFPFAHFNAHQRNRTELQSNFHITASLNTKPLSITDLFQIPFFRPSMYFPWNFVSKQRTFFKTDFCGSSLEVRYMEVWLYSGWSQYGDTCSIFDELLIVGFLARHFPQVSHTPVKFIQRLNQVEWRQFSVKHFGISLPYILDELKVNTDTMMKLIYEKIYLSISPLPSHCGATEGRRTRDREVPGSKLAFAIIVFFP